MKKQTIWLFTFLTFVLLVAACSKTYNKVKIGDQFWLVDNLNVDQYRNGDTIPEVKDPIEWENLTTGAWCYYDNNPANGKFYGKLYNLAAVIDPRWHVASDSEWITLTDFLGGNDIAGGKLKDVGVTYWWDPNNGATNESGFTALPGGYRSRDGTFYSIGYGGFWWCSPDMSKGYDWYRGIFSNFNSVYRADYEMTGGLSVRCIQDNLTD
jgi:uncharacterized protein (TIGR02145 family)